MHIIRNIKRQSALSLQIISRTPKDNNVLFKIQTMYIIINHKGEYIYTYRKLYTWPIYGVGASQILQKEYSIKVVSMQT